MIKPAVFGKLLSALALAGFLASPSGLLAAARPSNAPRASGAALSVAVDATEASRQVFHTHIVMAAGPGPLTLYYPKWIPGEHGPNGPLAEVAGLKLAVDGAPLAWHRDPIDMYAFHLTLPAGARSLAIDFDFLSPNGEGVYTSGRSTTAQLALLSWNTVVLYPQGVPTDDLTVTASLRLPAGWKPATALSVAQGEGTERIEFKPVSLTTLVDSPVLMGAHTRTVQLGSGALAHQIDMAADTSGALETPADFVPLYESLVAEEEAFFGGHHYRSYHFLLTLTTTPPTAWSTTSRATTACRSGPCVEAKVLRAAGGPAAARVHPFLERQVPPPRRAGDGRLPGGPSGRSCCGSTRA